MASPDRASRLGTALRRPVHLPQVRSVRVRLAIWNVSILAAALLLFIVLLRYQVQQNVLQDVDKDLANTAQDILHLPMEGRGRHRHFGSGDQTLLGRKPQASQESAADSGPGGNPADFDNFADGGSPVDKGYPPDLDGPGFFGGRRHEKGPHHLPPDGGQNRPYDRTIDLTGKVVHRGPFDTSSDFWDVRAFRDARDKGKKVFSTVLVDGEVTRIYTLPLRQNGDTGSIIAVLQVARSLQDTYGVLEVLANTVVLFMPLCILVAGIGGIFLTNRALRPVRRMADAASTITARELSGRLPESGGDEFAHLAGTFNRMLSRLEASFEQQRRFTSDASHELRTPLAAIKAHTSLALRGDRSADELRQSIVAADAAADRATRTVQDLLLLARSDTGRLGLRLESVDLTNVLIGAIDTLETAHHEPIAVIELSVTAPPPPLPGDALHLTRLFTNLLENALRHTPASGSIVVSIEPGDDTVTVAIRDTGEGIAPEHLPHIGERFYRVDSSRARQSTASGGTGLGFAITRSIVDAHGGTIALDSTLGVGTEVRVTLPRVAVVAEG